MSYDQAYKKAEEDIKSPGLHVKVYSQFKTYYDDLAKSMSAENKTGPFDILRGHANFLSILSPGTLAIKRMDGKLKQIEVSGGIVHVKNDEIKVFLDV